jgi:hypothetical protein
MLTIVTNSSDSPADASGAASLDPARAARRLRGIVADRGRRWKRWMLVESVALAVGLPLAYLWLVFLLDNLFHLPVWCRLLASAGFVAAGAWLVVAMVRRRMRLRLSEDEVALEIERRTPGGVQNRLINAIQISRESGDASGSGGGEFIRALMEENDESLSRVELRRAGELRSTVLTIALAGAAVLAGAVFWATQPERFTNAARRIMMPLAAIDPIYRTTLDVSPGDVEIAGAGDVPLRVRINGTVPGELTVVREIDGRRSDETIPVPHGARDVRHVLHGVERNMSYAVRGGDFSTRFYRVTVPSAASLASLKVTYQFPAYTKLPEKSTQLSGGDLEALLGTKARVVFTFDPAPQSASLVLHKTNAPPQTLPLEKAGGTEFAGSITFDGVVGYQLETQSSGQPSRRSGRYGLHVLPDQEPSVQLTGLERQAEVAADAMLPLTINANDDFGLENVGVYARRISVTSDAPSPATSPTTAPAAPEWKAVEAWATAGAATFKKDYALALASLGAAEGERFEVALRASDADPLKRGVPVTGPAYTIIVGGDGAELQLLYEQILRTEAELKSLITSEEAVTKDASAWMQKLAPASGLRWDDKANIDALAAGVKELAAKQDTVRQVAGRVAREMVSQAGNLKLSVGLLADTEMVRTIRQVESVVTQDSPQLKRNAMADAKLTQERTARSLKEILAAYSKFRQEWELSNMIGFVKMLAERQALLRDESTKSAKLPAGSPAASAERRQAKVGVLIEASRVACEGIGSRLASQEPVMAAGFSAAASGLGASELKSSIADALAHLHAGLWNAAAAKQDVVAKTLAAIHHNLEAAKADAARRALAALQEKAKSDVAAQKQI